MWQQVVPGASVALLPDRSRRRNRHTQENQDRDGGPYQLHQQIFMKVGVIWAVCAPMDEDRIKHGTDDKNTAGDANEEGDFVRFEHRCACQNGQCCCSIV